MDTKWSRQLAEQFNLTLPPDVVAWCDLEIWKEESSQEFSRAGCPDGTGVGGGLMLPDTLPILDNEFGDYLCLRFRPNGTVSEVIRWLHEGGMWSSYGNTLSEALLFDAALWHSQESGLPDGQDRFQLSRYADWALQQLDIEPAKRAKLQHDLSIQSLFEAGLAETAVRRELCRRSWCSELLKHCHRVGGATVAEQLGVDWSKFSMWLHDTNLIPGGIKKKLAKATGIPVDALLWQDWEGAKQHAGKVIEARTDLAWPFAILGWAAEREGLLQEAIRHYYVGLKALQSSADFTETWGITESGHVMKFAMARLRAARQNLPPDVLHDPYVQAVLNAEYSAEEGAAIRNYWLHQGENAEKEGLYQHAYQCYYGAGWDLCCFDDMDMILQALVRTARSAGWTALAKIAELHMENMP